MNALNQQMVELALWCGLGVLVGTAFAVLNRMLVLIGGE